MYNAAGEKRPNVADNFLNINETKTVFIYVNKNCLQGIFCVRDYVAVSRCFCHGVHIHLNNSTRRISKTNSVCDFVIIFSAINHLKKKMKKRKFFQEITKPYICIRITKICVKKINSYLASLFLI